jgi:hypothetical protein
MTLPPRLDAIIELEYGTHRDTFIARALINFMKLPQPILMQLPTSGDYWSENPARTVVDINDPVLKRKVTELSHLTGCTLDIIVVEHDRVNELSEYDAMFSAFDECSGATALLSEIIEGLTV